MMLPRIVLIAAKGLLATWATAVFAVCVFMYLSIPSVMRLRVEPPAAFSECSPGLRPEGCEAEGRLASAYWARTVGFVEWRYKFGASLPIDPPPEFALDAQTARDGGLEDTPANRLRYWRRLRQVWTRPETWEKSYEWNMGWVRSALVWMRDATGRFVVKELGFDRP
jgi:hypothetical protein